MTSSSRSRPVTTAGKNVALKQKLTNFWEGPDGKHFWLCGLCELLESASVKVARETTPQLEHSSVPVKLFLKTGYGQDRAGGQFADSFPRRLPASHGVDHQPNVLPGPDFNTQSQGGVKTDLGEGGGVAGRLQMWERRNIPSVKHREGVGPRLVNSYPLDN